MAAAQFIDCPAFAVFGSFPFVRVAALVTRIVIPALPAALILCALGVTPCPAARLFVRLGRLPLVRVAALVT